jgi:S-adenosylmethionine synthetase
MTVASGRSFSAGTADKLCDQVSDAVLDSVLSADPTGRVACETLIGNHGVVVAGEITTTATVDVSQVAREVLAEAGWGDNWSVLVTLDRQSPDISLGADLSYERRAYGETVDPLESLGAGDQGIVYGYACDETPSLLPAAQWLAHRATEAVDRGERVAQARTLDPAHVTEVSVRHHRDAPAEALIRFRGASARPEAAASARRYLSELVDTLPEPLSPIRFRTQVDIDDRRHGPHGPHRDVGITGRQIFADGYGPAISHGGGALSGKDPTKTDRAGAYAARWVARHVVASGAAARCQVQIAYAPSVARPLAVSAEFFGTHRAAPERIRAAIGTLFDLRPNAVIDALRLRAVRYRPTSVYGHFGRAGIDLPWEADTRVAAFRSEVGL